MAYMVCFDLVFSGGSFNFQLCIDFEITWVLEDSGPKHSRQMDIQGHRYDMLWYNMSIC